jgi:hypothetical protein
MGLTTPYSKKLIVTKVEQKMERGSRKRSSSARSEKMERVGDR